MRPCDRESGPTIRPHRAYLAGASPYAGGRLQERNIGEQNWQFCQSIRLLLALLNHRHLPTRHMSVCHQEGLPHYGIDEAVLFGRSQHCSNPTALMRGSSTIFADRLQDELRFRGDAI
jgi:hypothetical protein